MPNEPAKFEPLKKGPAPSDDGPAPASSLDDDHGARTSGQQAEEIVRPPEPSPAPATEPIRDDDVRRLGADLARAIGEGKYYPVVLFGTNNSGKTSLLLSLFASLTADPRLSVGISLGDSILGGSAVGRQLHRDATDTFYVKTAAFVAGEKILATKVGLPFFIPVELRPEEGKPPVRFAFLESNGEWYREERAPNQPIGSMERLFPKLRSEIEQFIAQYQGGISFLYLLPYTQLDVDSVHDVARDADEMQNASFAISGVLREYDTIRMNYRADDHHLMLVTKWDAHSTRDPNRAEGIEEDRAALHDFGLRKYGPALATFQGLNLRPSQRMLNSYCAGIINSRGLLQLRHDDDVRAAVDAYPIRLWTWLYRNALEARGERPISPFVDPPEQPVLLKVWNQLLAFISGK